MLRALRCVCVIHGESVDVGDVGIADVMPGEVEDVETCVPTDVDDVDDVGDVDACAPTDAAVSSASSSLLTTTTVSVVK